MQEVEKITVRKVLRILDAVKDHIQYAVEFDGVTYGNRKLAEVKVHKRNAQYPKGATRKHYVPYLNRVKDGGLVNVPFGGFDGKVLSANISAYCVHEFGKGNATVHKNEASQCIEVFVTPKVQVSALERSLLDLWDDEDEA
jgi:hypothetical protein